MRGSQNSARCEKVRGLLASWTEERNLRMRYDDPERPLNDSGAHKSLLQSNGSPLPVITLMYPMRDGQENYKVCTGLEGCTGVETGSDEGCTACEVETDTGAWGWLACIHAHRASNRFGTYYAWIRDLGAFQRDYLADPESALREYFKYNGPDYEFTERGGATKEIADDIFGGEQ